MLAQVFDSIKENKIAHIKGLNDSLDLSIILHKEAFSSSDRSLTTSSAEPRSGLGQSLNGGMSTLNPWQTLVPTEDPGSVLRELEQHFVSEDLPLHQFLEILTPTINFQEYCALLDVDMETLKIMVDHLIHWRKARIINVVNLKYSYKPCANLQMHRYVPPLFSASSDRAETKAQTSGIVEEL